MEKNILEFVTKDKSKCPKSIVQFIQYFETYVLSQPFVYLSSVYILRCTASLCLTVYGIQSL